MLIRTQSKKQLVNLALICSFTVEKENNIHVIKAYNMTEKNYITLGSYILEEHALEVLDLIQYRYDDLEFNKRCFEGYLSAVVELPTEE